MGSCGRGRSSAEDPKAVLLDMSDVGEDADFERIRETSRQFDS